MSRHFRSSQVQTYSLATGETVVRIASGYPDRQAAVHVRAISPAGEIAIIGLDPAAVSKCDTSQPSGNVFLVPAGADQKIILAPQEALYAKGTVDNVYVSTTTDDVVLG